MEESYVEDLASHDGPAHALASVRAQRSVGYGVRAGRLLQPRNGHDWGADVLWFSGRQHRWRRFRESLPDPAGSKNLSMRGISGRENREVPRSPACCDGGAGRAGKAKVVIP